MARQERYVVGLDIGTTKVCTVVGELLDDGGVEFQDVRLDRPDLEPPVWITWGFGLMALVAPLTALRALAG